MAIDAANVALLDLRENARPALAHDQRADVIQLLRWISVIELEHTTVHHPAIDARMRREIVEHATPVLDAARGYLRRRAPHVVGLVGEVVGMAIGGVACTAVGVQKSSRHIGE